MTGWLLAAAALAGCGLLVVRTVPAVARFLAWVVVLGFVVVASAPDEVHFAAVEARTAAASLEAGAAPEIAFGATAALRAAGTAGPRAVDLELRWTAPLGDAVAAGPLGATAVVPEAPLAIDPAEVQVRALGDAMVGRPLALAVEVPGLREPVAAEVRIQATRGEVLREVVQLDSRRSAECSFVPDAAGPHTIELQFAVAGHRVLARGSLVVGAAPAVLVMEPSGSAAAALRAQGVVVEEASTLPADWRQRPALVLGVPLPAADQQALVVAVLDGMGVFTLAPAFGDAEAPIRALLPVRPLPRTDVSGNESGAGSGAEASRPPDVRPPEPPPEERPPSGDQAGAQNVTAQPIEVDKRAIAMVLVVDRSGSMGNEVAGGRTKMSYAKTSALRTALALGPGDTVAVVTFGNKGEGRAEMPLTDAMDLDAVRAGVDRLAHAQEQTFLLSGLRAAGELLATSRAAVKHVVVVTDGEFNLSETVALHDLARRLRIEGKVTVSMVSIVDAHTEQTFHREAELLTRAGGGQFLPIDDPTVVPVLVSAEVTRALDRIGRLPRDRSAGTDTAAPPVPPENPAVPRESLAEPSVTALVPVRAVAPSPLLLPQPDAETWPSLGAAVPTTAPLDAQVLLVAGDAGWPLLAFGNRGLGRTGAFAADLFGAAGSAFRDEAAFAARLAQWVQAVVPSQKVRAPRPLVTEIAIEPPAPTARDAAALRSLAGADPVLAAAETVAPAVEQRHTPLVPKWAWTLVVLLVLLAVGERYASLWSWTRCRRS